VWPGLLESVEALDTIALRYHSDSDAFGFDIADIIASINNIKPANHEWAVHEYFRDVIAVVPAQEEYIQRFRASICIIGARDFPYLGKYSVGTFVLNSNKIEDSKAINKFNKNLAMRYENLLKDFGPSSDIKSVVDEMNDITAILGAGAQIQQVLSPYLSEGAKEDGDADLFDFSVISNDDYKNRAIYVLQYLQKNAQFLKLESAQIAASGVIESLKNKLDMNFDIDFLTDK
jgi:hypothetical protein